jgi:hypothetical protein
MDFIERLLGIAPDRGSGMLEAVLILTAVAAVTGVMVTVVARRRARRAAAASAVS